mgnify:CR=1 FL=1
MSLADLKKAVKEEKLVFGTDRTLKMIRKGKAKKVFISSNCSKQVREDIKHYASISGIEVIKLKEPNEELGIICKKPFSISVLCY